MTDLRTKLFESGILEKNSTEISAFKSEHRRAYLKQKQQDYAAQQKRKTLIFTNAEFAQLEQEARAHNLKLSPFLKRCIFAYLNQTFIIPDDSVLRRIEQLIREQGNGINETVRYIHQNQQLSITDIQTLKNQLNQLEQRLSHQLRNPQTVHMWLTAQQKNSAEFLPILLKTIATVLHENT